mmetsp:Transcript_14826/g.47296  ORF Transcript_14826/g.47296 Transcript_14826/m.47296 type:complete len:530 (+) Transcript_14826:150-1739(+)
MARVGRPRALALATLACIITCIGLFPMSAAHADPVPEAGGDANQGGHQRGDLSRPFRLVAPVEDHTKLAVSKEGIDVISRIEGLVGAVVVIGPYRSGKSFLLNQLLGVPCDEGFGVGHQRHTQTKGMWVWGEPRGVTVDGRPMSVLYVDTEGFESTGKADVYDDRIFALSAIISSVLIYNLPETVKEADIQKLSFANELGEEFYKRAAGRGAPFEPGRLLWLIQRDFLEGSTVQEMVRDALQPVKNPYHDKDIENVNRIRRSLEAMSRNSTAFGLVQPHLQRTKLCDLGDADLEGRYVKQREQLKGIVTGMCRPKMVAGAMATGAALADLIKRSVDALNKGEIPSAGSVVDSFNRDVIDKAARAHADALAKVALPTDEGRLADVQARAHAAALAIWEGGRFGAGGGEVPEGLRAQVEREFKRRSDENRFESGRVCEALEGACVDELDALQQMRLPSMGRLTARFGRCNQTFERECVGPARPQYKERLGKSWAREHAAFQKDYNARILGGMEAASLVGPCSSRRSCGCRS